MKNIKINLIILLIPLVFLGGCVFQNTDSTLPRSTEDSFNNPEAEFVYEPKPLQGEVETYTDADFGFTIDYPKDKWILEHPDDPIQIRLDITDKTIHLINKNDPEYYIRIDFENIDEDTDLTNKYGGYRPIFSDSADFGARASLKLFDQKAWLIKSSGSDLLTYNIAKELGVLTEPTGIKTYDLSYGFTMDTTKVYVVVFAPPNKAEDAYVISLLDIITTFRKI